MRKKILCFLMTFALALQIVPTQVSAKSKIKLNKSSIALSVGKSYKLKIKGTRKKVKWKSSNKKIATVTRKGTVKGKANGYTKITAKVGKNKYTCKVYVGKCIYSNKHVSVYYRSTSSYTVNFFIKNKTNRSIEFTASTLAFDSTNFYGGGNEIIKKNSVKSFGYDTYDESNFKKKPHKYLSFSFFYSNSKIYKEVTIINKIIGKNFNYTYKPHTKNILIDNSKLKVSYDSLTNEGMLFTVTNKTSQERQIGVKYLIINNHSYKEGEDLTFAPKSTGRLLYEGNFRTNRLNAISGCINFDYDDEFSFLNKAIQ